MKNIPKRQAIKNAITLMDNIYKETLQRKSVWSKEDTYTKAMTVYGKKYHRLKDRFRSRLFALATIMTEDLGQEVNLTLITYLVIFDGLKRKTAKNFLKELKKTDLYVNADDLDRMLRYVFEVQPKIIVEGPNITCYI